MTEHLQSVHSEKKAKPQLICNYTGKLSGNEFVGLKFENGKLTVNFPIGYAPSENEKDSRKDILNLISVLSTFSDHKDSFYNNSDLKNADKVEFPIHAYLFIINNFLNNGYYIERETTYNRAVSGKINWNRTIKQIRPQIADENVVYLDFITRKTNHNEAELITLIHKYCVYESFSKIGFLFSSFVPQKSELKFNGNLFKTVIRTKLAGTFSEKNQLLFKNMLDIINYIDSNGEDKNFYYGTEKFEHVWESLVDTVFGENDKEKFYPKCNWVIFGEGNSEHELHYDSDVYKKFSLRPDTIMITNRGKAGQKIFVLDSKYYTYGISNNAGNLPASDSITKQIDYAQFIEKGERPLPKDVLAQLNKEEIYNAFILPYNNQKTKTAPDPLLKIFGYAKSDSSTGSKKYHKIYGILLDVKTIMHRHLPHDNQMIAELSEKICRCAEMQHHSSFSV